MSDEKRNLYDLDLEELTALVQSLGQPAYRARQLWNWSYVQYAAGFDDMTSLPRDFRERLAEVATMQPFRMVSEQLSSDGQTRKVLFSLPDGNLIETVRMSYERRRTLCISTQAGCA